MAQKAQRQGRGIIHLMCVENHVEIQGLCLGGGIKAGDGSPQLAPCSCSHLGTRMGKRVDGPMRTSHMLRAYPKVPLGPLLQVGGLGSLPAPKTKEGNLLGPAQLEAEQGGYPDEVWSREEGIYHLVLFFGD